MSSSSHSKGHLCQDDGKLGARSVHPEPILRSPTSADKPSTEIILPISPTSTADVFLISLDEDLSLHSTAATRRRFTRDPSFFDSDQSLFDFDDELSQSSSDYEEDEEELLGLSFVEDENQPEPN